MWLVIDKNGWWFLPVDSSKTEVLQRLTIEHELKPDNHINYLWRKTDQKLHVVAGITPFMNASKI